MEATGINTDVYGIKQDYKYLGDDYWSWRVWIDTSPEALNNINYVTYILHPTFSPPIKEVKDRSTAFMLKATGWGTFTMGIKLHLINGEELQFEHELLLEYPDEGWKMLSEITIKTAQEEKTIQLLHGDLSAIPKKHATDILVISAYPGNYEPVQNTLMKALDNKGISVAKMAIDKEIDLRDQLNCWLSKPLDAVQQEEFNFKRILCFEPPVSNAIDVSVVGNIFRCINTFAFDIDNKIISLPLLASGRRNIPIETIVPAILDATIFWLEKGIPLQFIKLVVYTDDEVAKTLPLFNAAKQQYELKDSVKKGEISSAQAIDVINKEYKTKTLSEHLPIVESEIKGLSEKAPPESVPSNINKPQKQREYKYDFYISHARQQAEAVKTFAEALLAIDPSLKIFYDNASIPAGSLWIKSVSDAIQDARSFIAILSPEFNASTYCWDEFQVAKTIEYSRSNKSFIKTIYFKTDPNLPVIFSMYSYIDCTEEDINKLKDSAKFLVYK